MRAFFLLLTAIISVPLAGQAPESSRSYLCIPDYSVGYAVGKNGRWVPTNFDVDGKRYLLRQREGKWWWTDFGEEPQPQNACGTFNAHGFIDCHNFEVEVRFNAKSLRFQAVHPYGFVTSDVSLDSKSPITPYYEIGKCSPF
jgi:hypothetical protein